MPVDRILAELDPEYKANLRRRCQVDILYLGEILGYSKLLPRVHQPVVDLCVMKNPDVPIEEQDALKERLHLDPRGTYKTTLSIIDSVQWIIAFPNVRICKLTATKPLAAAIAGEITDHFVVKDSEHPTDFQLLFPEFHIKPRDKRVGEFTAPCRTRDWREATVMAFSIETSISGWHFDVMDPDDVVDTQNSSTPQGIRKVKKNYRINRKTLMPWGYVNFKGTRYSPLDLYGDTIEKATPKKIKMLIRAALKIKDRRRLQEGDPFPVENEVELLFPELLSFDFLKSAFEDDYDSFMTQYMNDAYGSNEVIFTKELLLQATVPASSIPFVGEIFIACKVPGLQLGAIATGLIADGRMFVVDVARGSFSPSAFASRVVTMAKKHGVHRITIEQTPGSMKEESTIKNYAAVYGWSIEINWTEFEEDDTARIVNMKHTEPLFASSRLLFSDALPGLTEIYSQFTGFGMIDRNEIPDVIARLSDNLPQSIVNENLDEEQEQAWERAKHEDAHDRIYGLGQYAPPEPIVIQPQEPYTAPRNSYGLDDSLGGLDG